ncbi:Cadherin-23 [Manis pentadactyla]|nr:Cadherin-23 [Manis pentadactyla]
MVYEYEEVMINEELPDGHSLCTNTFSCSRAITLLLTYCQDSLERRLNVELLSGSLITNNIANGMMMKYIRTIPLARRTLSQVLPVEAMKRDEELLVFTAKNIMRVAFKIWSFWQLATTRRPRLADRQEEAPCQQSDCRSNCIVMDPSRLFASPELVTKSNLSDMFIDYLFPLERISMVIDLFGEFIMIYRKHTAELIMQTSIAYATGFSVNLRILDSKLLPSVH